MTINEIIRDYADQAADLEIYIVEGNIDYLHTDRIQSAEGLDQDHDYSITEISYSLMNEEEYDQTVMANAEKADFSEWYDDKDATVLVIAIQKGCEVYEQTPADRIKEIRSLTGLSQTKFGDLYGIPMRTIQNWENGVSEAPGYVVDLLELAVWQTKEKERLFWGVVDFGNGNFEWEEYASRSEALKEGEFAWNNLSAHDQKHREEFYVGLLNENGDACVIAKRWKC